MTHPRRGDRAGWMLAWCCLLAGMACASQASGGDGSSRHFPAPPPARVPSSLERRDSSAP